MIDDEPAHCPATSSFIPHRKMAVLNSGLNIYFLHFSVTGVWLSSQINLWHQNHVICMLLHGNDARVNNLALEYHKQI